LENLNELTKKQAQIFLTIYCEQNIKSGNIENTLILLKTAIGLFPNNPTFLLQMANLLIIQQKYSEAKSLLQRANVLDKENKCIWISIVTLLVNLNQKPKLRMVLNEIFKQNWQIRELMILTEVLKNSQFKEEYRCFVNRVEKNLNEGVNNIYYFGHEEKEVKAEVRVAQIKKWIREIDAKV
jgi:tetratricopeptide (TPR) repeat protein